MSDQNKVRTVQNILDKQSEANLEVKELWKELTPIEKQIIYHGIQPETIFVEIPGVGRICKCCVEIILKESCETILKNKGLL